MAPKRGRPSTKEEEKSSKRLKPSDTPVSRSITPADAWGKVPFTIHYPALKTNKKGSRNQQELLKSADLQVSPFVVKEPGKAGSLNIHYTVTPSQEWADMKKYNNFIIQGDTYRNNDFVYVRKEGTPQDHNGDGDPKDFWIARILQVRAKDTQHVYALAAWMYWPEDLPPPRTKSSDQISPHSGKRTYHASQELIASNFMDVLDVLSFAGKAEVGHWKEEHGGPKHDLYWRQTYNHITNELSRVRKHCICNGHCNYDIPMFVCDNPKCELWIHESCLVDDILQKTYNARRDEYDEKSEDEAVNGHSNKKSGAKSLRPYEGKLTATIQDDGDVKPLVTITDFRPGHKGSWTENVHCPRCNTLIQ